MQSSVLTEIGTPVGLMCIMVGLGLSLSPQHFRDVLRRPRAVLFGFLCQALLLPSIALTLLELTAPSPPHAVGLLLLSACAGGAVSNAITRLAGGDTALSITLTSLSLPWSAVSIPVITAFALDRYMGTNGEADLPVINTVVRLLLTIWAPVGVGMAVRQRAPALARSLDRPMQAFSAVFMAALMVGVALAERENLVAAPTALGPVTFALNALALAAGLTGARLLRLTRPQAATIAIEIGIQNSATALFVALTLLDAPDVAVPAAVYTLVAFVNAGVLLGVLRPGAASGARPASERAPNTRADEQDLRIVFFGAGAVGAPLCAAVSQVHAHTHLLCRGPRHALIQERGVTLKPKHGPEAQVPVHAINRLDDLARVDVVVLCVKNYSLRESIEQIQRQVGCEVLVLALQNGLENRRELPRVFPRVVYGVVQHNAWQCQPGVFAYAEQAPLLLEQPDANAGPDAAALLAILERAWPCTITREIDAVAHNKLLANLPNSVLGLIGGTPRSRSELDAAQALLGQVMREGAEVLNAAGIAEHPIHGLPSRARLSAMTRLPRCVTRPAFRAALSRITLTSMQQDLLRRANGASELDSINGYLLELAAQREVPVPYNRALHAVCSRQFQSVPYTPLLPSEALRQVRAGLRELPGTESRETGCRACSVARRRCRSAAWR